MALALSDSEIYQIAVGCFYIFMRKAQIDFPGSSRAHPSEKVVINRAGPQVLRSGDAAFFPFSVRWDVWQFGVVPFLQDPTYQVFHSDGTRNQGNLALVRLGDYNTYIDHLADSLRARFQSLGYIPADPVDSDSTGGDSDLVGDGEPIVRVVFSGSIGGSIGDPGDSPYPIVDGGAGSTDYPIVED